jgi:hypothetical protein
VFQRQLQEQENQSDQEQDPENLDQQNQDQQNQDQQDQDQQQAGQSGGEPTDDELDPSQMTLGQLMQQEGLSKEQARQLLIAAAQGSESLQEYLQQIYVFPNSNVDQDW